MAELLRDTFDSYPTGSPPAGYTELSHGGDATWSVEDVATFGTRGVKASQVTTGEESLLKDALSLANGRLDVDIVLGGAKTNEQPSVSLRVAAGKLVQVRLARLDNVLRIADGTTTVTAPYAWQPGVVYHLTVEAFGPQITARAYQGSSLVAQVSMTTTITQAGQWGLRAVAGAGGVMYWDNLAIAEETWNELASTATVVEPHSDLVSAARIRPNGMLRGRYTVNPIGLSDLPAVAAIFEHSSLQSTAAIPFRSTFAGHYTVTPRLQVTVVLVPAADAFVWEREPLLNYGDLQDLVIGQTGVTERARSLLRWDFGALRADLVIVAAELRVKGRILGAGQAGVHAALGPWEELGVTWANQPPVAPLPQALSPVGPVMAFDVTSLFQAWYAGKRANYGVMVRAADEAAAATILGAREAPDTALLPELLVTFYLPDGILADADLACAAAVRAISPEDLPSQGTVGGIAGSKRGAGQLTGAAAVARPNLPATAAVRVSAWQELGSSGYVYERNNLTSTGSVRVVAVADCGAFGYVANAPNELPSRGVVDGYPSDLGSSGGVRVWSDADFAAAGYVRGAPNELPSDGHVSGGWLRSFAMVHQVSDLGSVAVVRSVSDLPSTGFVWYRAVADLAATGTPRIRDAADLGSAGEVRGHNADLMSAGHVGPWTLRTETAIGIWPPEGRSPIPPAS